MASCPREYFLQTYFTCYDCNHGRPVGMNSTLLFIGAGGLMTMVVLLSLFHLAPRALGTTQFEMVEN